MDKKMTNSSGMAKCLEAISAVVVRQFDELSNSTGFHALGAGKFFINRVHRYLQQECIKWMLDVIDAMGHAPSYYEDGRNQWALEICREIMKSLEEKDLYFSRYRSEEDYKVSHQAQYTWENTSYKDIDKVREFFELPELIANEEEDEK